MTRAEPAPAAATAPREPRVVPFQSPKTDSWLCRYVNPFFCDLIPTATVTAPPAASAASTPKRGR